MKQMTYWSATLVAVLALFAALAMADRATLIGPSNVEVAVGSEYKDAGVTPVEGHEISTERQNVNTARPGLYIHRYYMLDRANGQTYTLDRRITVVAAPEPKAEEVKQPEPVAEEKQPEPVAEEKQPEPVAEEKQPEPVAEQKQPEPVAEEKQTEPVAEQQQEQPKVEAEKTIPIGDHEEVSSAVVVLDEASYDDVVFDQFADSVWLVDFYAPWCGHCRRLEPVWDDASVRLESTGVKFGKIDCDANPRLARRYNVHGFPTILAFRPNAGVEYSFTGARTVEGIEEFVSKLTSTPISAVSADQLGQWTSSRSRSDSANTGFVGGFLSGDAAAVYEKVALQSMLDADFFESGAEQFKSVSHGQSGVAAFRSDGVDFLAAPFTEERLDKFVRGNRVPRVADLSTENYNAYRQLGYVVGGALYSSAADKDAWTQKLKPISDRLSSEMAFVTVDMQEMEQFVTRILEINPTDEDVPTVVAFTVAGSSRSRKVYHYDGGADGTDYSEAALSAWFKAVNEGRVSPNVGNRPLEWLVNYIEKFGFFLMDTWENPSARIALGGGVLLFAVILFGACMFGGPSVDGDKKSR